MGIQSWAKSTQSLSALPPLEDGVFPRTAIVGIDVGSERLRFAFVVCEQLFTVRGEPRNPCLEAGGEQLLTLRDGALSRVLSQNGISPRLDLFGKVLKTNQLRSQCEKLRRLVASGMIEEIIDTERLQGCCGKDPETSLRLHSPVGSLIQFDQMPLSVMSGHDGDRSRSGLSETPKHIVEDCPHCLGADLQGGHMGQGGNRQPNGGQEDAIRLLRELMSERLRHHAVQAKGKVRSVPLQSAPRDDCRSRRLPQGCQFVGQEFCVYGHA